MQHILIFLLIFTFSSANSRAIYKKNYGSENKIALVIGNKNYTHFKTLKNTLNDAQDMRDVLKSKGFEVFYLEDGDLEQMREKVDAFETRLKSGGIGFFYYAGHGLEVKGKNYLIPSPADIKRENKVKYRSLSVDMVIEAMQDSHNRLNIVVLDACRNNPFGDGRDLGEKGLASINNAKGMYIAFATAPKKKASDGEGRNGLFTKHLLDNIKKNNLTLDEVFGNTREGVYRESNKIQLPWTSSSVIGNFYFSLSDDNPSPQNTTESTSNTSNYMNVTSQDRELIKCNKGYAESCTNYGAKYYMGWGVSKNYNIAMKYYQKGCDLGHGRACANLGLIYAGSTNGYINEDQNKAKQLYRKACNLDYIKGCKYLSELMKNSNIKQDLALIKCNKGYAESCTEYGAKYYMGWGVSKNYNIAMKYYQKGCDLGHGRACANLGLIYAGSTNGYINEDQNRAKQLYRKACNLGYEKGCVFYSDIR